MCSDAHSITLRTLIKVCRFQWTIITLLIIKKKFSMIFHFTERTVQRCQCVSIHLWLPSHQRRKHYGQVSYSLYLAFLEIVKSSDNANKYTIQRLRGRPSLQIIDTFLLSFIRSANSVSHLIHSCWHFICFLS